MRVLADESFDMAIVRSLRSEGHDVQSVAEEYAGAPDEEVAELATSERRLLITEDRDFGRLFYAASAASEGVIFLRYPAKARAQCASDVVRLLEDQGESLRGAFVVMQPGRKS